MAIPQYGAMLRYSADGTTYTDASEISDIKPGGYIRKTGDATHLNSTNQWKELVAGWKEQGELQFTLRYSSTSFAAIYAIFNQTATTYWWQIGRAHV